MKYAKAFCPGVSVVKAQSPHLVMKSQDEDTTEIYLYDVIDPYWGIDAETFVSDLSKISAENIKLRINSPGGSCFDGIAIYNALKRHPAKITAIIDGTAASMASIIALAADNVYIVNNGFYMIHKPWGFSVGDAEEMRSSAELLDKIEGNMISIYAEKSGLDKDKIAELLSEETWMTAEEASEYGFVDQVIDPDEKDIEARAFAWSDFKNAPKALIEKTLEQESASDDTDEDPEEKEVEQDENLEELNQEEARAKAKARIRLSEVA